MDEMTHLTLVTGGAASGKSHLAERLVEAAALRRVYLATAEALDTEMETKIARHKARRGPGWITIEEPRLLAPLFLERAADEAVLLDCATLWLSNQLFAGADIEEETATLLAAVSACTCPVVIVSNEVGAGIVPENALARRFRAEQGALNQRLAARAGRVIVTIAGLPFALKGTLPEALS